MKNKTNQIVEFTIVFNRLKKRLYNYLLRMVSDKLTAEDITQNVFLKLFENYDKIKDKNKIDIWAFKTAKFEAYNFYRGKKTKVDQFYVEDADEVEKESDENIIDILELKELEEIVSRELENLPIEQKEVFVLKELGGLSYKEIAEVIGFDENLVRSRLHLARKKLMKELSKIY